MAQKDKLKDPRVCRIFMSSPFNGLEDEREELTKRHWPRVQSLCASRGVQLRVVDMRWGITQEASKLAQTAVICLKELDRSDIFVGFFGQRYGWHGADDEVLQENYANGQALYPWIGDFRDRSITELEYLHGHLNDPGKMPACIAFRDKTFDDEHREVAVKEGDKRGIAKFSSESEHATMRMDDLKRRVKETEDKTLGVDLCYKTPQQGMQFLFDCVWKYITEVLFAEDAGSPPTARQVAFAQHDAFIASKTEVYIPIDTYMTSLNDFVKGGLHGALLVTGESGVGKSALLTNWIKEKQNELEGAIIYHFIGCSKGTTRLRDIIHRIGTELKYQMGKHDSDQPQEGTQKDEIDARALFALIKDCAKFESTKFIIVIDALDRLDDEDRMEKPLYWFPVNPPPNVRFILSTNTADSTNIAALQEKTDVARLEVDVLGENEKRDLCLKLLAVNSKELTSDEQLPLVLGSPQTSQPLFMKILMEELCQFGRFRQLTDKIKSLLSSENVVDLFFKVLERLEGDYGTSEELVRKVMCTIHLSRTGMTETELTSLWDLTSDVWSPLFFAVEKLLVNRVGKLALGYRELGEAIDKKYLTSKDEKKKVLKTMSDFFYRDFELYSERLQEVPIRVAEELPYLLCQLLPEEKPCMLRVITNMCMVPAMYEVSSFDLIEHWFALDIKMDELSEAYIKSLDDMICRKYLEVIEQWESPKPVSQEIYNAWDKVRIVFADAKILTVLEKIVTRELQIVENLDGVDENERQLLRATFTSNLAIWKCEKGEIEEACKLHRAALDILKTLPPIKETDIAYADSLHGIAVLGMREQKDPEQIKEMENQLTESMKVYEKYQSEGPVLTCMSNLAQLKFNQGMYDEAIEMYHEVIKRQEEFYFNVESVGTSYSWVNLGLCYRHQNELDKTEECYKKALDIKVKALGWKSIDVGQSLLNLGGLEMRRQNFPKASEYSKKAREIYQELLPAGHTQLLMAMENECLAYANSGMTEEMEKCFWQCYSERIRTNTMQKTITVLFRVMFDILYKREDFEKLEEIILEYMKHDFSRQTVEICYLAEIDAAKPEAERPKRPYDISLQIAKDRAADDIIVFKTSLKIELMPKKDFSGILDACEAMFKARKDKGFQQDLHIGYCEAQTMLLAADLKEEALDLAQKCPHQNCLAIIACNLFALRDLGRIEEALTYKARLDQAIQNGAPNIQCRCGETPQEDTTQGSS